MKFDLPKDRSSIIKVIGVGGGGSNAVNHMYEQGISGVDFIVCNTDHQSLDISPVPVKLQLGASLTKGMGAGSIPEVGRNAAIENIDDLKDMLGENTNMVFVTAGMGGGTGTGAAPVIAKTAKDMGVLTVGIVTVPFNWEGKKRRLQAEAGINEIRECVDTLVVINNDKLRDLFGNLTLTNSFAHADNVLATAAKGIAEIITHTGIVNVDFQDVRTVMSDSGVAIMGSAEAEGEDRAMQAAQSALASPLLNDNDIAGAKYVLLNITYGDKEVLMDEVSEITDHIQAAAGLTADVIWGYGQDDVLGDQLRVTIIATGFDLKPDTGIGEAHIPEKKYVTLNGEEPTMVTQQISSPTQSGSVPQDPVKEPQKDSDTEEPYLKPAAETQEPQTSIEFEVNRPNEQVSTPEDEEPVLENCQEEILDGDGVEKENGEEKVYFKLEDEAPEESKYVDVTALDTLSPEEQQSRAEERVNRVKELSMRLRTPSGLADLENEPAFKRKNVKLNDVPHSSESELSKYTLSEEVDDNGERRAGLRPDNPFVNPAVD